MSDTTFNRWSDAERVLDAVLGLPLEERHARAAALCGDDGDLMTLVARLLAYDEPRPDLPSLAPPVQVMASALAEASTETPATLGPYRLIGEIGRGGMGRVMRAVREDGPVALPVAIKLLDVAVRSADARRRFDRERDMLSRLHHPHIARLLDGGVDGRGTPYLVMELVEGASIDQVVTTRALDVPGRVRLFLQVCGAVAYAHGQLILHRDIKPANVLVDVHGHVKLLDFGIAKWLEDAATGVPPTLTAERALTPAYAAPEQLMGRPVGTATDVYQLGLLLYELLTSRRAHGDDTAASGALHEAVVEREPPLPSRAAPATVAGRLAGDLDAVVMKALRKDPPERYPTVDAFARDLEDYLAQRPVSARRGTTLYLLRKYVRRHRVAVSAAAGVLVALLVGAIAFAWQARRTAIERDRAVVAERRASAINEFLVRELLSASSPERSRGAPLTVVEVLDTASRTVGGAFADSPAIEADIRQTLARTYASLGRSPEARRHAEAAERLLAASGADEAASLRARALTASLDIDDGRYDEARRSLEDVRRAQEAAFGAAHPDTLQTRVFLVRALRGQGEEAAAERESRQALTEVRAARPGDWRTAAELQLHLAGVVRALGRVGESEATARALVDDLARRLGDDHPGVLAPLSELWAALTAQLKYREALAVGERSLRVHETVYGPQHPLTGLLWLDLSVAYDRVFRDPDALAAAERAYAILRAARGEEHPDTLRAWRNVGVWHRLGGDIATAEPIYRRILEVRRRTLGETHRSTRESRDDLLALLTAAGRTNEAGEVAREIARVFDQLTATTGAPAGLLEDYADFLLTVEPESLRDLPRALALATRAIDTSKRRLFGPLRTAAMAHEALGRPDQAIRLLQESLALPDALPSWTTEARLVRLLRQAGRDVEAERALIERLERFRAARGPDERLAFRTMQHLARLCEDQRRIADAERWWRDALAQLERTTPEPNFQVGLARADLGVFLIGQARYGEAEPLLRSAFDLLGDRRRVSPSARVRVRDALARTYAALGKPRDAAAWRGRGVD